MLLTKQVGPDVAGLAVQSNDGLETRVEVAQLRSVPGLNQLVVSQPVRQTRVRHRRPAQRQFRRGRRPRLTHVIRDVTGDVIVASIVVVVVFLFFVCGVAVFSRRLFGAGGELLRCSDEHLAGQLMRSQTAELDRQVVQSI